VFSMPHSATVLLLPRAGYTWLMESSEAREAVTAQAEQYDALDNDVCHQPVTNSFNHAAIWLWLDLAKWSPLTTEMWCRCRVRTSRPMDLRK
jgi:hypothetical protein